MASTLFKLPDDLVIAITTELKRVEGSTADLLSFTLASKRCHRLGLPIFYGNITLANATLGRFVNSFNTEAHGKHVRSLTARFEADAGVHPSTLAMFTGPAGPPVMTSDFSGFGFGFSTGSPLRASTPAAVAEMLEQLVPIIPSFVNLKSFSLYVSQSPYRSIPRATIILLLEALPTSCTNLELDTRGQDHREEDEQAHVCDVIRGLLPHMHHVRIRIGAMCGAMFSKDGSIAHTPHLKSLLVNCGIVGGSQMQLCGQDDYTSHAKWPTGLEDLAWSSVIDGLRQVVSQQADALKRSRIYAMIGAGGDSSVQTCQTELRVDIRAKTTWAFPVLPFGPPSSSGAYIMRLHDGAEYVFSTEGQIEAVSEGFVWKDDIGGARLPAKVLNAERDGLPSFATGCVESRFPVQTGKEWAMEHASVALSTVWRNEEMAGERLASAEMRVADDYLFVRPIRESTPDGWVRTRDGCGIKRA
jgi:hypothetical protein